MAKKSGNASIRFWDGKVYSEAQLNEALRGLASVVRANPVLVEQWPMWRFKYANGTLIVAAGVALAPTLPAIVLWTVLSLIYGFTNMQGFDPLGPALVWAGFGLFLGGIWWPLSCLHYPSYQPVITVKDGVILARTASGEISVTAKIEDCCWYNGWVGDTALSEHVTGLIFGQRAIVIRFPKQSRFGWRHRVAVGLTEQYHAIWEAFLKLADVPQISDKWSEPIVKGAEPSES